MSLFCTNCGKELPDGAVFCDNCGTKFVDTRPQELVNNQVIQPNPGIAYNQPSGGFGSGNQSQMGFGGFGQSTGTMPQTNPNMPAPPQPDVKMSKKKSRAPLIICIIAVIIIIAVAGILIGSNLGNKSGGSYEDQWMDMVDEGYIDFKVE